jgi:hypothetical protein
MTYAQLHRAWPWLTLLLAAVLAACNGPGSTAPGGY